MAVLPDPDDLRQLARNLGRQARHVDALLKAGGDRLAVRRARRAFDRIADMDLAARLAMVDEWLDEEAAGRRTRLATGLRRLCEEEGVELVVITRDPLELRLPPLGVVVDVDADRADLSFGRQRLARVPAEAGLVMDTRRQLLADLEGDGWDARGFHAALRTAWRRAPGEGYKELVDVLPQLVLALQSARFLSEPSAANFRPYSRAAFCYDLWRLRRDRALCVDGWRLSLGTATGGSTRDKKRVFWLEDDRGDGQYYLTLRFVAADDPDGGVGDAARG